MPLWVYDSSKTDKTVFSHGIVLNLQIEPESVNINDTIFNLKDIKARSDFYAISRFVFPFFKPWDRSDILVSPTSCFNILGFTEFSSLKVIEVANIFKQQYPIQVFFAPETENFMDAIWMVTVDKNLGLHSNIEAEEVFEPDIIPTKGFNRKLYTPRPFIHGPTNIKANDTVPLTFEYRNYKGDCKPCNFKSYIKSDAGYLPKSVAQVKDGYATVNVTALGLTPGDTMTVKFGIDKVYSNAAQHTLTVV